jgi:hypothetical protein
MLRWAAFVVVGMTLLVACSSEIPPVPATDGPTRSPSPTASPLPSLAPSPSWAVEGNEVLLRLSREATMAPAPGSTVETPPLFTLYSDGRVIYVDYVVESRGGTAVSLQQAHLSEDQVTELIAFALRDGGLAEADASYLEAPIFDAPNTIFEIHGGGVDKGVLVSALGYTSDDHPDAAMRTKLEFLAIRLENFGSDVANGGGEDLGEYEPTNYLVTLNSYPGPSPDPDDVREWPWPELVTSDFAAPNFAREMTSEQMQQLVDEPLAAPDNLIVETPEGGISFLRIRALLPDEVVPTT